jgi:hypothetical protein
VGCHVGGVLVGLCPENGFGVVYSPWGQDQLLLSKTGHRFSGLIFIVAIPLLG